MISLDVKSLYTNVPRKEAKDKALRKLYEQDEPASIARKNQELTVEHGSWSSPLQMHSNMVRSER